MVQTIKERVAMLFWHGCYMLSAVVDTTSRSKGLRRVVGRSENLWGELAIQGLLKKKFLLLFLPKTRGGDCLLKWNLCGRFMPLLKVSKNRNGFMKTSFLPKTNGIISAL